MVIVVPRPWSCEDVLYRGLELYFEAVKRLVSEGGRA